MPARLKCTQQASVSVAVKRRRREAAQSARSLAETRLNKSDQLCLSLVLASRNDIARACHPFYLHGPISLKESDGLSIPPRVGVRRALHRSDSDNLGETLTLQPHIATVNTRTSKSLWQGRDSSGHPSPMRQIPLLVQSSAAYADFPRTEPDRRPKGPSMSASICSRRSKAWRFTGESPPCSPEVSNN